MGKGSLEADDGNGEPLALRTDGERFTSLLGGSAGGVLSGNIGVVEPEYEKATEPLDCEMAAEPGRRVALGLSRVMRTCCSTNAVARWKGEPEASRCGRQHRRPAPAACPCLW